MEDPFTGKALLSNSRVGDKPGCGVHQGGQLCHAYSIYGLVDKPGCGAHDIGQLCALYPSCKM
jgi:hypothetical protein